MNKRQQPRLSFYLFVIVIVFILGVGSGFFISSLQNSYDSLSYDDAIKLVNIDRDADYTSDAVDFSLFWIIWDSVKKRHINQPVNETDMFYGAIAGMVSGLGDPYSVFLNPTESQEFIDEMNGSIEGIGAEIGIKKDKLTIIAPLAGSPAEKAGLLPGDVVLGIDGIDTGYMTVNIATDFIRGDKGTAVVLTVAREGVEESIDISIVRDTIAVESVEWEMKKTGEQQIAYIQLTHFNSDTALKFQNAVNDILLQQPDGIIVDVRNNSGGFLDASIDIASKFLEKGSVVVVEQSADGSEEEYKTKGAPTLNDVEVVVLINRGAASASEILAGALKYHGHATLIGTTSFGKGTVQDLQRYQDGSSLKLTISRWLTPGKVQIQDVGIDPDYYTKRTAEDYSNEIDPQLDIALEFFADQQLFLESHNKYDPSIDDVSIEDDE